MVVRQSASDLVAPCMASPQTGAFIGHLLPHDSGVRSVSNPIDGIPMPVMHLHIWEGPDTETKNALAAKLTQELVNHLGCPLTQ